MKALPALASLAFAAAALAAPARLEEKDLVATASGDARFSTLVALVQKAGLADTLKGAGPYTLFAPTNDAFAKVPKAVMDQISADPATLKKVLAYHVVSGKLMAADLRTSKTTTLEGEPLAIRVPKAKKVAVPVPAAPVPAAIPLTIGKSKAPRVGNARIVAADIAASNGVIHAIDRVLVPPSLGLSTGRGAGGKKKAPAIPPVAAPTGGGR